MYPSNFSGTIVDLVTPLRGGELDRTGLNLLIEWQIQSGIEGLLVCGEASESHCLSESEREAVLSAAIEVARGRVPILVGIMTNATTKALAWVEQARRLRADGALLVTPYYNKPCQEGVYQHVATVSGAARLPVLVLNRPSATAISLGAPLVERIADLPNVAGLVDVSPDHACAFAMSAAARSRFALYRGDDRGDLASLMIGATGCFSWVANVAPRLAVSLQHAANGANIQAARGLQTRLQPLLDTMRIDHPVSVLKQALAYVFGISPEVRLPLLPMEEQNLPGLRNALSLVGLSTEIPFLSAVAAATNGGLRHRL
ncbi:dihydrodipicolinate synthase family protein [Rhizobium oryzicola]|uniref:Dihydrodipicolinate synthase family protein n=1 Tax=Rhizobium oryzicola TaxID=1232668 RepID=A0ABT8STU1_9HYPH|nr:dihydrodipicolinate synthase family protein [Rhizobium oryzicola]MDO1581167.1 dihydrodipicolinate synthase family protein [Rhizobium oryzicola]